MKLTKKQIENTRMAYAIMAGFPAHKINLGIVRQSDGSGDASDKAIRNVRCGTSGCVAGVLSAHPYFQAQGFKWPNLSMYDDVDLFGNIHIFSGGPDGIEGKKVALAKLRQHLHDHGVITAERNRELMGQEARMTG